MGPLTTTSNGNIAVTTAVLADSQPGDHRQRERHRDAQCHWLDHRVWGHLGHWRGHGDIDSHWWGKRHHDERRDWLRVGLNLVAGRQQYYIEQRRVPSGRPPPARSRSAPTTTAAARAHLTTSAAIGNASAAGAITLSGYDMALGRGSYRQWRADAQAIHRCAQYHNRCDNASDFALNPLEILLSDRWL